MAVRGPFDNMGSFLACVVHVLTDDEGSPKEEALLHRCRNERASGRLSLKYTIYTGTRDTTPRLKRLLETAGFKTVVLRAQVDASRREDWIVEQKGTGIEVLVTHLD